MKWRVQAATQTCGERGRCWISAPFAPISDGKCAGVRAETEPPADPATVAAEFKARLQASLDAIKTADYVQHVVARSTNIIPLRRTR